MKKWLKENQNEVIECVCVSVMMFVVAFTGVKIGRAATERDMYRYIALELAKKVKDVT